MTDHFGNNGSFSTHVLEHAHVRTHMDRYRELCGEK